MTRRLPATFIAAALMTTLAAPTASARPGPGQLDDRRDDLLGEMQDHLARWKARPARPPTPGESPARPPDAEAAPPVAEGAGEAEDGVGHGTLDDDFDGIQHGFDGIQHDFDGIQHDSDGIQDGSDGIQDGSDGIQDGSDGIQDGSDGIAETPDAAPGRVAPPTQPETSRPSAIEPAPAAPAPALPPPVALPDPPTLPAPSADAAPPSIDAPASSVDGPIPLGRHDAARIAAAVLAETNAARARHGLPPVEAHPVLDAAAIEYSAHLARTGHFGHIDLTRAGMEAPGDRVRAAGGADVLAAENLITETWLQVDGGEQMFVVDEARHQYSRTPGGPPIPVHTSRSLARSMVQRWLASPGHRRNILDAEGRQMGFGMAWDPRAAIPSLVAVQVFQRYHRLGEGVKADR